MFIDGYLDRLIAAHPVTCPITRELGNFLNFLGKGDTITFLCVLLLIAGYFAGNAKWVKSACAGILAIALSGAVVQALKHIFGRARPQMNLGSMHFIGPNLAPNGFDSFPSGHAIASFTAAAFFSYYYPKRKTLFYSLAAAISIFGRVLFRHHFPSDVLAGGILGIFIGWLAAKKFRPWVEEEITAPLPASMPLPEDKKDNTRRNLLIVAALSCVVLFYKLGGAALWDRDETEYSQATIEMENRNEWLIPTLEGEPFLEKPILMYWFLRPSYLMFGENEYSSRLPSAVFGILTCIAAYFLGQVLWGYKAGLYSAATLSTSFLFAGSYRMLMTDPFFVFFNLLTLLFYACSIKDTGKSTLYLILSYIATGFAVLAKGPIALFPIGVFLIFEWRNTEFKKFLRENVLRHFLLSFLSVLIAFPWFAYSFSVQKGAAETFFLYENIARFLKGSEGHTGPMYYYLIVILFGFLPWSPFLFTMVKKEWKTRASQSRLMEEGTFLLSIWITLLFVFFTVSANKLPHYILPALPAAACLMGKFWKEQAYGTPVDIKNALIFAVSISLLLAAAPASLYFLRPKFASTKLSMPFALLAVFYAISYLQAKKNGWRSCFTNIILGALSFYICLFGAALPWVENFRVTKPIALALKRDVPTDAKLIGYKFSEPSLFIYSGRLFPKIEATSLDSELSDPRPVYVVTTEKILRENNITHPYTVLASKEGFAENSGEITLLLLKNFK